MKAKTKNYLINLIFPALVFGSATGILTALVVLFYKFCAMHIIEFSETAYQTARQHPIVIPTVIVALFLFSFLISTIYKKVPNIRGGGIPTSIGILRGIITFKWLRNVIGTFLLSLTTFLIGVPLGNEGPSVQMGTALGRGSVYSFAKRHRAWDRYAMTGGACAGFSVATGAPISGIMFAVEEAHQRISPMIIIVSATAVMFSRITTEIFAPLLGVSISLFPAMQLISLKVTDVWMPLLIGIAVGLFAVLFLNYSRLIRKFFNKTLKKIPHSYKIFLVYLVTFLLGLYSFSFISTGHELILSLIEGKTAILTLILLLFARSSLTLSANSNKITGGIFLPILALGTILASILGETAEKLFGLEHEYYVVLLMLGITACISGMMKMPLTAIFFSVEALSCYNNVLHVITVSAVAFVITEIFGAKSINDTVVESFIKEMHKNDEIKVFDTFVTVQKGAFAVGKQIRDIFWPANLFVLSLRHDEKRGAEVDEHGGKEIREGDVLHVRYSTYDEPLTKAELTAIVGEQEYDETQTDVI